MIVNAITLIYCLLDNPIFPSIHRMADVSPKEASAIANEAYVYFYSVVEAYRMIYAATQDPTSVIHSHPFNPRRFVGRDALNDPTFLLPYQAPSVDTLYASAYFDLRAEPIVLGVPEIIDNRYYAVIVGDMYGCYAAYLSNRTVGAHAGNYLIAPPDWKGTVPEGITDVYISSSMFAASFFRVEVYEDTDVDTDVDTAAAVKHQFAIQPLSKFLGRKIVNSKPLPDFLPVQWDPNRTKQPVPPEGLSFFNIANYAMQFVKIYPEDAHLFKRFAIIGIIPGQKFDPPQEICDAITRGMNAAHKKLIETVDNRGSQNTKNGWSILPDWYGSRQQMQGRHFDRALGAMVAIFSSQFDEAIYIEGHHDKDGKPIDATKYNYILTFSNDCFSEQQAPIPRAKGFWSVTMYREDDWCLVPNSANQYLVRYSTPGLKYEEDGSLKIYIQTDPPDGDKKANWLPAPKPENGFTGHAYLVIRIYWPYRYTYLPPPLEKIPKHFD